MHSAPSRFTFSERRRKTRYPIQLNVNYRTNAPIRLSGIGYTIDMSSSGLLFTCSHALHPGMRMEVTLEWPSLLDSVIPLQLVTSGKIVRADGNKFGMAFSIYQFRTMKRRPLVHAS